MFKLICTIFLTCILFLVAMPAAAAGSKDHNLFSNAPSVCDELLEPGITGSLYNLCYAYCERLDCDSYEEGAEPPQCDRLLTNYNRQATEFDPPMPCLEVEPPPEPVAFCPCWGPDADGNGVSDEVDYVNEGIPGGLVWAIWGCTIDHPPVDGVDSVSFWDFLSGADLVFSVDTSGCVYSGPYSATMSATSPAENAFCRQEVHAMSGHYGGFENCGSN